MKISLQHITGAVIGGAVSGLLFYTLGQHDGKQDAALKAAAGCATSASNCAGWRQNDLSAAGLVALTKVDRPTAERVEGHDQNGKRQECW